MEKNVSLPVLLCVVALVCACSRRDDGVDPLETVSIELTGEGGESVSFEFVKIPAGTFMMGNPKGTSDNRTYFSKETLQQYQGEGPPFKVTVSNDFYLGKYEVTQAQWQAVMGVYEVRGNKRIGIQVDWDESGNVSNTSKILNRPYNFFYEF